MTKKLFLIALLITALSGTAALQAQTKKATGKTTRPAVNKPAPDFTLKTAEGKDLSLSSLQGHIVLVDFWASWCMPCRATIPHLKEIYTQYHNKGLEILSVSLDANESAWKRAMTQEQMPWPQVIDSYTEEGASTVAMNQYGIKSIPYVLLVDKTGKIISINPSPSMIDEKLQALCAE